MANPGLRLLLACRMVGVKYVDIEREEGLSYGKISAYCAGRQYAYPKLKRAVTAYIARAAEADEDQVRALLFGAPAKRNGTKKGPRQGPPSQPRTRPAKDRDADTS